MAKLIEVLKKRDSIPVAGTIGIPQVVVPVAEPAPIADQELEPAFSFIELDGVSRQLEGSPDVLPGPVPFTQTPIKPQLPVNAPKMEATAKSQPEPSIVYHPWSGSRQTGHTKVSAELLVYYQPDHPISKQYIGLLDQVLENTVLPQALLLPSPSTDPAVSVLVLNLALAGSLRKNHKVALVELSSGKSRVAQYLGMEPVFELRQVLEGKIALEQALQGSPVANLFILTNNETNFPQEGYWNRDALGWILNWLRNRFSLTLIQVTGWAGTPEQQILASLCDGVHPVLRGDTEANPEGAQMVHTLASQGARIRGVIHFRPGK